MNNYFDQFVESFDFSRHTKRAFLSDLKKFSQWFQDRNREAFKLDRITMRDVADYRNHLQNTERKAVSTVNRALVTIRRFMEWSVENKLCGKNVAKGVKEIRRQALAPQGLQADEIRRLFREAELRQDVRTQCILSLFLYTGCRISDLVELEINDITIGPRSGAVVFRCGKGNKQRTAPLPNQARQAIQSWLTVRPHTTSNRLFIGKKGDMTDKGIRNIVYKYGRFCNIQNLHPHAFRHCYCLAYLKGNPGDLPGLAQIVGHENIATTTRYSQKSKEELDQASENVDY